MKYQIRIQVDSPEETVSLGNSISGFIRPPLKFSVDGPLGAGKTTFIKSILTGFGVDNDLINSPTFNLVHEFETGEAKFFHLDLYRLKIISELEDLGIFEELDDAKNVFFIEWAYKIKNYELFEPLIGIFIKPETERSRVIHFFADNDETGFFFSGLAEAGYKTE